MDFNKKDTRFMHETSGRRLRSLHAQKGFTITELLVVMAISGVVMAGVYSTFYSQQKSYAVQNETAAMQQNLRAALFNLKREIRMAGYDPEGGADAGILTAGDTSIRVGMDVTDDSGTGDPDGDTDDVDEKITYLLTDTDGDGINDLARRTSSGTVMAAEHIDALDFEYLDRNGTETSDLDDIRCVQITVVARTGKPDLGHVNNTVYRNQNNETIFTAPGDNYRRQMLTAQVKCRNLGLQ
jgi:type IV pilus assembly protein PilW